MLAAFQQYSILLQVSELVPNGRATFAETEMVLWGGGESLSILDRVWTV
jgi:hypothetical protein